MNKNLKDIDAVKLKSIDSEIELDMIESILKDNDIPFIVKNHGAGGYMRIISGLSVVQTDVFVSQNDFKKATELLEAINIS